MALAACCLQDGRAPWPAPRPSFGRNILACCQEPLVAFSFLVAMPFVPSCVMLLIVRPAAPRSVLPFVHLQVFGFPHKSRAQIEHPTPKLRHEICPFFRVLCDNACLFTAGTLTCANLTDRPCRNRRQIQLAPTCSNPWFPLFPLVSLAACPPSAVMLMSCVACTFDFHCPHRAPPTPFVACAVHRCRQSGGEV